MATKTALKSSTFAATGNYQGFYLRNNIKCTGALPAVFPYDACPDVIQSIAPLTNPSQLLGSASAWQQTYNAAPNIGSDNYYYLRGKNGTELPTKNQLSCYYAPAQLVPFPGTWQANQLLSQSGAKTVALNCAGNAIGVAEEPFLWPNTTAPQQADFYTIVTQSNNAQNNNPVPTISSWLDMSELLTQNLGFGFRSTCYVEGNAANWQKGFQLNIPAGITPLSTLTLTISYTGMQGNQLSLSTTPALGAAIQPFTCGPDNNSTSVSFTQPASYSGVLTLNYANLAGAFPVSGAAISVTLSAIIDQGDALEAGLRGLLQPKMSRALRQDDGMPIQQTVIVGQVSFVVG